MKYATRVNSFLRNNSDLDSALEEIGKIDGIEYVDLNYPEHFSTHNVNDVKEMLKNNNLLCNGINLRFRDLFLNGEFGNNNLEISKSAIRLTKEAIDVCKEINGSQVIIWLGFDGFDYSFQINYNQIWDRIVDAFKEICDYSSIPVSIEYKPYEERTHSIIDSFGSTMLMVKSIDKSNLGVTLDFCHMLMKKENPAFATSWLLERGKLFNMHLNDGEGSTDDGLMVGTVHLWKTIEVFYYLIKYQFNGVVYFDTFPKRENAVGECEANIKMCRKIESLIHKIGLDEIEKVIEENDAITVSNLMVSMMI